MSENIVEKLRSLLTEKFKHEHFSSIELLTPAPTEKWFIIVRLPPFYDIFLTSYKDGRVEVDTGPVRTGDGIREFHLYKKYRRKYEEAKTEEERREIYEKKDKEEDRIIEDFRQGMFKKYLRMKGSIAYYAKEHMWANEVARRVSDKYGFEVRFNIDYESGFVTTFNSAGMDEEQMVREVMRRVDAIAEAREMFISEDMWDEFLISKGIEPVKSRRRRRI
ncbi:MAG: hypothetical protein QW190_06495 [Thermoproteota archaeon]